jgi:hypothetical protein
MSANFNPDDRNWLLGITKEARQLNDAEEALVFTTFDAQTSHDIDAMEKRTKHIKFLKRVCLYKLLTYPFEIVLFSLFFNKTHRTNKRNLIKLYWKFLRNRISLNDFKKELTGLSKEGKIL